MPNRDPREYGVQAVESLDAMAETLADRGEQTLAETVAQIQDVVREVNTRVQEAEAE